jgi:hypothetical protein
MNLKVTAFYFYMDELGTVRVSNLVNEQAFFMFSFLQHFESI